jgi:hypothetical protein
MLTRSRCCRTLCYTFAMALVGSSPALADWLILPMFPNCITRPQPQQSGRPTVSITAEAMVVSKSDGKAWYCDTSIYGPDLGPPDGARLSCSPVSLPGSPADIETAAIASILDSNAARACNTTGGSYPRHLWVVDDARKLSFCVMQGFLGGQEAKPVCTTTTLP